MQGPAGWLVIASLASIPSTLTHAVEDFSVGIHQRFGLSLLPAAFLVALGYTAQLAGAMLAARRQSAGYALNLGVALVWLLGSVLDHLGEVLFVPTGEYRAGLISKLLEVGIMLISAAWATLAVLALRAPVPRKP